MDLAFALLRALSDGQFHSSAALAQVLSCSRSKIAPLVQSIESDLGLRLHRVRGRGYRLPPGFALLSAGKLRQHLGASPFSIEMVDSMASTNSALLKSTAAPPHVLIAEHQHAGRGRMGRTWQARLGGSLTFSLSWRFACGVAQLSGLSLVIGVILARVLDDLGVQVRLKWPNDVLLDGRKLAGILIEMSGDLADSATVIIGMGLNLNLGDAHDPSFADLRALDLPEREWILAKILQEAARVLPLFAQQGFAAFQDEWNRRHAWMGKDVTILAAQPVHGRALGVNTAGALLLQMADGKTQAIFAGDVSLRLA